MVDSYGYSRLILICTHGLPDSGVGACTTPQNSPSIRQVRLLIPLDHVSDWDAQGRSLTRFSVSKRARKDQKITESDGAVPIQIVPRIVSGITLTSPECGGK